MFENFTLIIPSHNRHQYLDRILEYYEGYNFDIIVVDSTKEKYVAKKEKQNLTYLHYPQFSLPQKLAAALKKANTPFTALLADDDFIIPAAIITCTEYLEQNPSYSSVQGNVLVYQKAHLRNNGDVEYKVLYKNLFSFEIDSDKWDNRLRRLFNPYRSFLWAVHRTETLSLAYSEKADVVSNLFFSEYLTGIIPVVIGKIADLNILYQVRENTDISDDKTTENIDGIIDNPAHQEEVNNYIEYISSSLEPVIGVEKDSIAKVVLEALKFYANTKPSVAVKPKGIKKKIGGVLSLVPFIGKKMIDKNRQIEINQQLNKVIKTKEDVEALSKITAIIKKYEF